MARHRAAAAVERWATRRAVARPAHSQQRHLVEAAHGSTLARSARALRTVADLRRPALPLATLVIRQTHPRAAGESAARGTRYGTGLPSRPRPAPRTPQSHYLLGTVRGSWPARPPPRPAAAYAHPRGSCRRHHPPRGTRPRAGLGRNASRARPPGPAPGYTPGAASAGRCPSPAALQPRRPPGDR